MQSPSQAVKDDKKKNKISQYSSIFDVKLRRVCWWSTFTANINAMRMSWLDIWRYVEQCILRDFMEWKKQGLQYYARKVLSSIPMGVTSFPGCCSMEMYGALAVFKSICPIKPLWLIIDSFLVFYDKDQYLKNENLLSLILRY